MKRIISSLLLIVLCLGCIGSFAEEGKEITFMDIPWLSTPEEFYKLYYGPEHPSAEGILKDVNKRREEQMKHVRIPHEAIRSNRSQPNCINCRCIHMHRGENPSSTVSSPALMSILHIVISPRIRKIPGSLCSASIWMPKRKKRILSRR